MRVQTQLPVVEADHQSRDISARRSPFLFSRWALLITCSLKLGSREPSSLLCIECQQPEGRTYLSSSPLQPQPRQWSMNEWSFPQLVKLFVTEQTGIPAVKSAFCSSASPVWSLLCSGFPTSLGLAIWSPLPTSCSVTLLSHLAHSWVQRWGALLFVPSWGISKGCGIGCEEQPILEYILDPLTNFYLRAYICL